MIFMNKVDGTLFYTYIFLHFMFEVAMEQAAVYVSLYISILFYSKCSIRDTMVWPALSAVTILHAERAVGLPARCQTTSVGAPQTKYRSGSSTLRLFTASLMPGPVSMDSQFGCYNL